MASTTSTPEKLEHKGVISMLFPKSFRFSASKASSEIPAAKSKVVQRKSDPRSSKREDISFY